MAGSDSDLRPALGVALVILVASLVPIPASAGESAPALLGVPLDKWAHAVGYGVLTGLLAWGRQTRDIAAVAALAVLATGYGAGIELLQGLVPSRGFSAADMAANAAGAAAAVAVVVVRSR